MSYVIVGLGNPGEEYDMTRHNLGRMAVSFIQKKVNFPEFESDKKIKALVSRGVLQKNKITLLLPDTFMNKSGQSIAPLVTSVKKAHELIVIHDDLDLPLGKIKISFNRSSGGHRGVESIVKALKTTEFIRVRVGISAVTSSGKIKKPKGDDGILNFIIGKFKPAELDVMKKVYKNICEAVSILVTEGKEQAMGTFNA